MKDEGEDDYYQVMNSSLYLSPILLAYEKTFKTQQSELQELRTALQESTDHCVSLAQENQRLHDLVELKSRELLKTLNEAVESSGYMSNFAAYKQELDERCAMLTEENQVLLQQVETMRSQLRAYTASFQQKIGLASKQSENYQQLQKEAGAWKTKYLRVTRDLQIVESNYKSVSVELEALKMSHHSEVQDLLGARRERDSAKRNYELVHKRLEDVTRRSETEKEFLEKKVEEAHAAMTRRTQEQLNSESALRQARSETSAIKEKLGFLQKDYEHVLKFNEDFQNKFENYREKQERHMRMAQELQGKMEEIALERDKMKLKEEQYRRHLQKIEMQHKEDLQKKVDRYEALLQGQARDDDLRKKKSYESRVEEMEEKLSSMQQENFELRDRADRAERDREQKLKMIEQMKRIQSSGGVALDL